MKRFPLFPLSRFPALARAAVGGAVALGLVALGVLLFGSQDEAPEEFSASLLTSGDTTSFKASFDLFYLQSDDPTVGSGTWSIPANAANAAATLDIGLVPNTNESDDFIQVDTAEFLLAGVPTWLAYSSIAASSDAFTVDVVEGAESGGARDITIFVSPEEFSGDGSSPDTTISGVGNLLTGAEVISVNFEIASVQGSVAGDQVGSFDIFGTYVARDADFTRYQLDGNGDGQDGGAGAVTIEDSGIVAPIIASAVPHSSTEIRLTFEKAVDATTAQTAANYVVLSCDDSVCASPTSSAAPASVAFASESTKTVVLTLDSANAMVDADSAFDASSVVDPLNFYAVQVSNVAESTGIIVIEAANNTSASFSYHEPDIALVVTAKDLDGNVIDENADSIEVHDIFVAEITADTAGSYFLHASANGTATCSSTQEHSLVLAAGVTATHEFSFESSGTYSFVVCGGSDADGVVAASNEVSKTTIPETIDVQLSLATADDGSYTFDTKDTLLFSVTADFSNPSRGGGRLSLKVDSCDASSRQIDSGTVTQFDAADVDGTTTQIDIAATDIGVNTNGYSVVACVESGTASDESAPVGFSIDWALPVVGAPENATLQTTEETQITVTSDIAGSLIVKAFDASFSSTPSCSTGTTIYSSIEDAESFTVPLIGGLVWDENAKDYHANGLAQGEHTLLACVETAESAYEKQSSAEITVTVEPATPPTITVISNGGLGAGSQEVGNGITVKFTSDPGANLNGSDAAAKLIAFDKLNVANSCTDTADYTLAESNDNFSSESSLSFAAGDQLPVGEYIIRLCVTVDEVTSDESWNFEVEAFAAPTVSVEFDGSESNEQNIDTNGSATLNISATGENDLALALWNVTNELAENRTCSALTDESSLVDEDNDFHGTGKFTSVPLSGAEYGLGTHTFLACVTRSHGDYTSISEGATATLTVSEPGTPSVVIAADFIPSGTIYPSTKITVEATATATDFGGGLNDWSNADAELHANITSCPAPGASIITRADDSTSTLIATATSSASGETIEFPAFFAEILGVTEDGESQHNLVVCVTANGATGQDSTEITLKDYETPTVTATITPATIDTTEIATLTMESDYAGTLTVYTGETFCEAADASHEYFSGSIAANQAAPLQLTGEHLTDGEFAAGNYDFLVCVNRGESYGNKTGSATDTLEVEPADPPQVSVTNADLGEVYPDGTVELTATIIQGESSWTSATANLYLDINSCDAASSDALLVSKVLGTSSASGETVDFSFAATELGAFGQHNLLVCATANDVTSNEANATAAITYNDFEIPVVDAFVADTSISTAESTTLNITSNIAGTLAVYQTSITSCNALNLPATSHTNATAATSFSVDLVGEHATNGDLAAGTYTYLACVTSTNGKTGGSMDANDAQSATLTVTDVDAASVQLSLSPSGEVAKNTEITATITSDQVNADGADTMATLHKDACDGEQFGLQTLLSGDALSGYEATISFAATETMNMVACATVNGKEGVSDQATITVKEDEVVVVEGEDIKITTTTSSGETATLTADAGQVSSGTTLTLVDLEVEESESLPEEAINAVEIDIDIDDNLNGSLTLGIPTEGNKLEESMELQKWDETTGEWVTVGEATLSEDGTTYNADITESGKYALVDLAEARKDIDEDGGTVTVEDGDLAGTTVEFPTNAMDGEAQVAVLEPDPSILPDDSLGAVEIVAEQEDFGDEYVTIVIPSAAPGANENPVVTFYDEDDYDKDGITDEWISDGIRNTKFINENIDECKAANGGCAPTPDPLASVGNWFIEFETNHFSIYTGSSEPAPEPGETPVGIRIADGETFRLGYRQTLALRPAGGTGPYTLSVSPADSGSFTDLSGSAITQVAELEDFVFVPDTPVIGNDGRNGIVLTLTDTKGTNDDASDDEQASMTLDLLRRGNMIDLDESFTNGNDGNQVMAGWNESAPFVPTVTGEESGTLSSVGIRLDFSPNKTLRLLRQQTLVFSAGTGDSHAVSLSDSSAGEIVSGNDGTYTFIPSTADNGGKQTTIIITETTDDSQETTAIPVYILARGNTYDKEDSDGLTTGLDANEIMAGWKNE